MGSDFTAPDPSSIRIDPLEHPRITQREVSCAVLRLDLIHPHISGNKWFKLKYWLREAEKQEKNNLLSLGGPYSNHLLALASAGKHMGWRTHGIVRGQRPGSLSATLLEAESMGMQLHFLSRKNYTLGCQGMENFSKEFPGCFIIPAGGYGRPGARGAAEILNPAAWNGIHPFSGDFSTYTHIACAAGTGTTLAGLLNASLPHQSLLGIPVMRHGTQLLAPIKKLLGEEENITRLHLFNEYHFGGYGKSDARLLNFMRSFYEDFHIPTDFVYTGKLMYAVLDQINEGYFPSGSRILLIHTGGLQGNRSLPSGSLPF
jgi:1-aminocyclopropane-1-carboxylate deaminase